MRRGRLRTQCIMQYTMYYTDANPKSSDIVLHYNFFWYQYITNLKIKDQYTDHVYIVYVSYDVILALLIQYSNWYVLIVAYFRRV